MRLVIWGTDDWAEHQYSFYTKSIYKDEIAAVVNMKNDEEKRFHNHTVQSPDILRKLDFERLIICTEKQEEVYDYCISVLKIEKAKIDFDLRAHVVRRNISEQFRDFETMQSLTEEQKNYLRYYFSHNEISYRRYLYGFICNSIVEQLPKFEKSIVVDYDTERYMYYVTVFGKKMYFPTSWRDKEQIKWYTSWLLVEQLEGSPHKYEEECFKVENGVLVDCGAAEGIFALSVIDKLDKVYLIEALEDWIEALQCTFEPYKDKAVIIKAMLNKENEDGCQRLDSIIHEPVDYIKMDIEGYEANTLAGAEGIINKSPNLSIAACAYHFEGDEQKISEFYMKNHFHVKLKDGYIFTAKNKGDCEYGFKRGMVYGWK